MVERPREIRTIQALRAVACLLVVIFHAVQGHTERLDAWPNGAAGVDLFFVISGFVMVTSSQGLIGRLHPAKTFLARRLRRIVPLYWLLTAAKLGIAEALPTLTPHTAPNLWNVAASLMFIPARDATGAVRPVLPVGWTLNFEMLFYVLFALALAGRVRPGWIVPALAGLATAGFWRTDAWPAPLMLANGMVLEFAAGMAVAVWWRRPGVRTNGWAGWFAASGAVAAMILLLAPSLDAWRFIVWGVPAGCLVACAVALEARVGRHLPRLLTAAGDASFATYLVHPFVIGALASHGAAAAWAAVPASVTAGFALHRWIDAPMQRALKPQATARAHNGHRPWPQPRSG